jgi:hypothetical protein
MFGNGIGDWVNAVSAQTNEYPIYQSYYLTTPNNSGSQSNVVIENALNYDAATNSCIYNGSPGTNQGCVWDTWADFITGTNMHGIVIPFTTTLLNMSHDYWDARQAIGYHFGLAGSVLRTSGPWCSCIIVGNTTTDCDCVPVMGPSGGHQSDVDCMDICCPSWNCVSPGNCQDPGNGSGTYSTLTACENACPPETWNCVPCSPGSTIQQVGVDSWSCGANSTYVGAMILNPVPNPYNPILVEGPLNPGNPLNIILLISIYYPTVDYDDLYWESIGPTASPPGCNNPVTGNAYWTAARPSMGFAGSIYQTTTTNINYGTSWNDFMNNLNLAYQALGNGSQGTNLTPFTGLDALDACNMMTATCPYFNASTIPSWTTVNTPLYGTMFLNMGATGCGCSALPITTGFCIDPGDGTGTHTTLNDCLGVCPYPQPSWDCTNPGTSSNCHDPGCGQGQFATLTACQNNCITPIVPASGMCGCNW